MYYFGYQRNKESRIAVEGENLGTEDRLRVRSCKDGAISIPKNNNYLTYTQSQIIISNLRY